MRVVVSNNFNTKLNKRLLYIAFTIYIFLLIWVVMFKCGNPKSILGSDYIKEPLGFGKEIGIYMSYSLKERFLYDFIGKFEDFSSISLNILLNIFVFIFIGLYIPIFLKKIDYIKCGLIGLMVSLFFELYQLFTAFGSFSFIDIISNTIGAILGLFIFSLLAKALANKDIAKIINRINLAVIIIFIPVLIFAGIYTGFNFKCIIFRYSHINY